MRTLWTLLQMYRDQYGYNDKKLKKSTVPSPNIWPSPCTSILLHPSSHNYILGPMITSQPGWDTINLCSMAKQIEHSFPPIIITRTKTCDQARVPVNKTMNDYSPAYKASMETNQPLHMSLNMKNLPCWPSWCHSELGPGTEYTRRCICMRWKTRWTGSMRITVRWYKVEGYTSLYISHRQLQQKELMDGIHSVKTRTNFWNN